MTPQERQLVDDLFDRLAKVEGAPRDSEAAAAIQDGLRKAPNALYVLVQTVLLQDEALKRAGTRIQELEQAHAPEQSQSGGFLDSMRDTIFGKDSAPRGYGQGGYGSSYGAPPFGGGGSFLGTAAAAAAGMVGGSLLMNGIRSMMGGGGHHQAFGDTTSRGGSPWSDNSNSSLARDAGINDIGRSDSGSRAGLFDQAEIDRQQDADQDAMDLDSDDFGSGDDSDYA
jgi:hypothetical protein